MFLQSFLLILAVAIQPRTFTFDQDPVGAPPPNFEFARPGRNADEANCSIYHTINHFIVWFDGEKVLDAHDDTFQSGRVGMWTKADSVIEFGDFIVAR